MLPLRKGSKNETSNSSSYLEENTADSVMRKSVASWYMWKVSRTQSVPQIRDTAVAHLANSYSESVEELPLYCPSCLLSAVSLYLMCMGLPQGPALLWPADKAPRALSLSGSPAAGCLLIHTGIFHLWGPISTRSPYTFSADRKMQVFTVGNSQPLSPHLKHDRWEIVLLPLNNARNLWRSKSPASNSIRWHPLVAQPLFAGVSHEVHWSWMLLTWRHFWHYNWSASVVILEDIYSYEQNHGM